MSKTSDTLFKIGGVAVGSSTLLFGVAAYAIYQHAKKEKFLSDGSAPVQGVVGAEQHQNYIRPEDRIRYLEIHSREFGGMFPKPETLRRRDRKLMPEMRAHFYQLIRNGHPSRQASNMTIDKYKRARGHNLDIIRALTHMGIVDRRLGAPY